MQPRVSRYSPGKLIQSGRSFLSVRSRTSWRDAWRITQPSSHFSMLFRTRRFHGQAEPRQAVITEAVG